MARPMIGITPNWKAQHPRGPAYLLHAAYAGMIAEGGAMPVILPLVRTLDEARETVARIDGLLLTGGADIDPGRYGQTARRPDLLGPPERIASDCFLARAAQERGTPTLGVCLGVQVMNVEFGGSLVQEIPEEMPGAMKHEEEDVERETPTHPIEVVPGTLLARAIGTEPTVVNSFHHQSAAKIAPGFRVAAKSPDGVVEAVERTDHPFYLGVQWHPERMPDASSTRRLIGAFLDAVRGAPVRAG